jgi:hypothetical protein
VNDTHIVRTFEPDEDDRCSWECSCGRGGSAAEWRVEEASDKHIQELGASRIDRHPGNSAYSDPTKGGQW